MNESAIRVERATARHLADLSQLLQAIRQEDAPEASLIPETVADGLTRSLCHFPALQSDSVWVLIAYVSGQPGGLAVLTRIPKLDARLGFLYLDELHILEPHRRQGVGRSLLQKALELADSLGLAGVRLLARPHNEPAQRLYESEGFHASQTLQYEKRFDRPSPGV